MQKMGVRMSGAEIKALRKFLGMNQSQFAGALGVSFTTVSRWESEEGRPNDAQMEQIRAIRALRDQKGVDEAKLRQSLLTLGVIGTLVAAAASGIVVAGTLAGSIAGFMAGKKLNSLLKKEG